MFETSINVFYASNLFQSILIIVNIYLTIGTFLFIIDFIRLKLQKENFYYSDVKDIEIQNFILMCLIYFYLDDADTLVFKLSFVNLFAKTLVILIISKYDKIDTNKEINMCRYSLIYIVINILMKLCRKVHINYEKIIS